MCFRKIIIVLLTMISMGLSGGCIGKNKIPPPVVFYTLDYAPPEFKNVAPLPVFLSIEKFRASPPYDTARIVYSTEAFAQNRYYYHQWITSPEEMVTRLLTRDLVATGWFGAVTANPEGWTTHHLSGTIDEFYEQDVIDQWFATVSITTILVDESQKDERPRICFQKTYKRSLPCAQKNPKSLARAMSQALSEISTELTTDIHDALKYPSKQLVEE